MLSAAKGAEKALQELRAAICSVDKDLLQLVARRQKLAEALAPLKKVLSKDLQDPPREAHILAKYLECGGKLGLEASFCKALGKLLIQEALKAQKHSKQKGAASYAYQKTPPGLPISYPSKTHGRQPHPL